MADPKQAAAAPAKQQEVADAPLLEQIIQEGRFNRDAAARERGKDMIQAFVAQVVEGQVALSRDADATINARIAQIDHLISLQLNDILHHADFQKIESAWRGLKYL